jgi:hypothetical protein
MMNLNTGKAPSPSSMAAVDGKLIPVRDHREGMKDCGKWLAAPEMGKTPSGSRVQKLSSGVARMTILQPVKTGYGKLE